MGKRSKNFHSGALFFDPYGSFFPGAIVNLLYYERAIFKDSYEGNPKKLCGGMAVWLSSHLYAGFTFGNHSDFFNPAAKKEAMV